MAWVVSFCVVAACAAFQGWAPRAFVGSGLAVRSQRSRSSRPAVLLRASAEKKTANIAEQLGVDRDKVASTTLAERQDMIEEWLMKLELPQPLKAVLGSAAWSSFAAALMQMGVVAVLSALGTFLEQGGPPEFYAQKYPSMSGVILALGFDHMYSCPLFYAMLILLAASIVACTGTTQLPLARRAQRLTFRSPASMQRAGNFLMRLKCQPEAVQVRAAGCVGAERLEDLRSILRRRGFIVRADESGRLAATRGLVGKFAPMVVHLALLFIMGGGAVGLIFGASSEVLIGDGGFADVGQVLEKGRRAKGLLYDLLSPTKGLMDATLLRVEDFRIEYRDDGAVDQFYSKLSVEDAKTKQKLMGDEIYVNKPLRYGGSTIYQADWGIDRLQVYLNGQPLMVPMKPLPDVGQGRSWGAFLPEELVTAKDPTAVKKITSTERGLVLVCENMRNVQVYGFDKSLAGILRSPDAKVQKKMEGMPVQFGEVINVEGGELRLDRILGATGLIVKSDPGVPLVYLGFALLMPATLLSVLPYVQVWAALADEDPDQVVICGRANRNQPAFEDEMKAIAIAAAG